MVTRQAQSRYGSELTFLSVFGIEQPWQLGNVTRHSPRLVHRQHLSVVGIGPRVAHGWGAVRFCTFIFYVGLGTEPSCLGLLFRQRMRYSEDAL